MKKTIFSLATMAMIAASCSDYTDINSPIDPNAKEMISFSLSDGASSTRAGFTGSNTSIAMRIQSDEKLGSGKKYTRTVAEAAKDGTNNTTSYSTVTFTDANIRYWDDAHGRKSLLSVFAVAIPNGGASIQNGGKTLEQLLAKGDDSKDWGTNSDNTIEWTVSATQEKDPSTATSPDKNIDKEDLVYANNIQSGGKDGIYRWSKTDNKHMPDATGDVTHKNGQMLFFQDAMTDDNAATTANTDAPGHFDKGHLKFNHALSRISVKLVAGDGYTKQEAAGSFDLSSEGVQFLKMNVKGKLDIPTGKWTADASASTGTITTKPSRQVTKDDASKVTSMYYETVAQMLPDYVINDADNTNMITFKFDGNEYFVTQDMIFDALNVTANQKAEYGYDTEAKNKFTMQQGKNYKFEITINKKQIEAITATLKAWDDVSAEFAQDNTHITVTTSSNGTKHEEQLNLFRLEQTLDKIYTDDSYTANGYSGNYKDNGVADLKEMKDDSNNSYDPKKWYADEWYYKDNKTAYHLRMLNDLAADENGTDDNNKAENVKNPDSDPKNSYFTMKNGAQTTQDYHWGAPMTSSADLKYNTSNGYTSSIHKGFVAPANGVSNPINITELHMMSNINVVLKTTETSNAINLRTGSGTNEDPYKYATVKITKLASDATVDIGTGLVTPGTTIKPEEEMTRTEDNTTAGTHYFVQTTGDSPKDDITTTQPFTWAVVPQTLVRTPAGTGTEHLVGITITTPDNNEYYVVADLSKIVPSGVGSQVGQMHNTTDAITRWYPNHSYTYTFTLTKKGIEAITCTLADWVTVTGKDTNITLEN